VPRYRTEVGFFDLLSDSRVIVEAPEVTREKLQQDSDTAGSADLLMGLLPYPR